MGCVFGLEAGVARLLAVPPVAHGPGLGPVRPDVGPLARASVPVRDQPEGLGRGAHCGPPAVAAGGGAGDRSSRARTKTCTRRELPASGYACDTATT